jgi:predicted lysophospholipase L1 biosynthesis ABC-type transport system permease subunit
MRVAILSRAYARKLFGDASPIGHWIGYTAEKSHDFQVVGVVGDARVDGLRADAPPVAYISLDQNPQPVQTFELRVTGSPRALSANIRGVFHTLAPGLPVTETVPLDVQFQDDLMKERLLARLTGIFGALTLALAAVGFYGLLSSRVARRTPEIGIRMALGATRARVLALFLSETVTILLIGMAPGAALSLGLHSMVRQLLYGAGAMDAWALVFSIFALAAAGILATLIPARRAASIDPMQALRTE